VSDQPGNSAFLTVKCEAAFELLSVRTGIAGRPPYRCYNGQVPFPGLSLEGVRKETRHILSQLVGEQGQVVRANFERLGEAYRQTWKAEGDSTLALGHFLTKFIRASVHKETEAAVV
jgi:hypothetical protein